MRALSVKQPWAWLICAGYKDIENRNWKIGRKSQHGPYSSRDKANFTISLPERVYIHAGKGRDIEAINEIISGELEINHDAQHAITIMEVDQTWSLGAIIGEVVIVDCVTSSPSPWFTGPYGFVLKNPKLYDTPIPYKGQLGFFEVPER